jgi:hypothetical protein
MSIPAPLPWPASAHALATVTPLRQPVSTRTVIFREGALTVTAWKDGEQQVALRVFCERSHCDGCECDTDHHILMSTDLAVRLREALAHL